MKLVHSLCDALAVDGRVGQTLQHLGGLSLRGLELLGLALLGHLRRLLRVRRVDLVPLLEPNVRWLGRLDDLLPRDVLFVACRQELKQLQLELSIESRAKRARGNDLKHPD